MSGSSATVPSSRSPAGARVWWSVSGAAGLTDAAGQPLRYTPHDFRRIFATEAVTGGLPVHIAARLLGHASLATTQAYLAVFQDDLVRSYRAFLDKRRAVRPAEEYREPTDDGGPRRTARRPIRARPTPGRGRPDAGTRRRAQRLREALSRLSSDGLITITPHRGAAIRRLSRAEVAQFYELREVLEGLAARLTAQRIDESGHRERLTDALAALEQVARTSDMPHYIDENITFHRVIMELSGHARLAELVERLQLQTFRVQFRSAAAHDETGMRDYSCAKHARLVGAILAGNAAEAEDLMRTHLRHTGAGILQLPDADFA